MRSAKIVSNTLSPPFAESDSNSPMESAMRSPTVSDNIASRWAVFNNTLKMLYGHTGAINMCRFIDKFMKLDSFDRPSMYEFIRDPVWDQSTFLGIDLGPISKVKSEHIRPLNTTRETPTWIPFHSPLSETTTTTNKKTTTEEEIQTLRKEWNVPIYIPDHILLAARDQIFVHIPPKFFVLSGPNNEPVIDRLCSIAIILNISCVCERDILPKLIRHMLGMLEMKEDQQQSASQGSLNREQFDSIVTRVGNRQLAILKLRCYATYIPKDY